MQQVAWLGCLVLLLAVPVRAAEEDHEQRIRELEQENRDMRERLDVLEARGETTEEAVDSYLQEGLGLDLVIHRGNAHGVFQIFGSTGVGYDNPAIPGRSNAFFFNGNVDFFLTARFGDNFHVLSETVFLTSLGEPRDGSDFDQERLWSAWKFSDRLQIKIGLEHGPISRWNNLFHHGRWLELTIQRPFLARFESGGGILPMHNAGVEFSGHIPTGAGRLQWIVIVSNGRGRIATDTQEFSDRNDHKAVDLGLGFSPEAVDGLWIGVFVRIDEMPPNPSDPARQASIDEMIGSLQVDFRGERFEALMEFAYIENEDQQSGGTFGHYSTYVQVGFHAGDRWTPYTRIDFREMEPGDPYFAPLDRDLDIWEWLLGVRFDFTSNAAIKLEIGFGEREERNGGGAVSKRSYTRVGLQVAFVF